MNERLKKKLQELPKEPGVYFHKNSAGEIIYVGKAAVLRNRVRQYFQKSRTRDVKTDVLVSEIDDTDWMVVESELEALFLEAEMIRRYMPRYNILLRDDKAMGYIRIDYDSDYPTVGTTRRPLDDGAKYFGPYLSMYAVRQALRLLRRVFPFATKKVTGQKRANLQYHLGLDPGLESGKTSLEDYRKNLKRLMAVIQGKKVTIIREIENEMKQASTEQRFEEAGRMRNQLRFLSELGKQIVFSDKEFLDISKDRALVQLAELFGMKEVPRRIEGYDISHMSGTNVVASMVVFTNGVSDKNQYRKFKMSHQKNDDAGNMRETIKRRFSARNIKSWGEPSLVLIDGGKPQINAAFDAMKDTGVSVPCVSVAKREEEIIIHKTMSGVGLKKIESLTTKPVAGVFVRDDGEYYVINLHVGKVNASSHSKNLRGGLTLSPYDDTVKLLQRIRDESHRFAVSYHSSLKTSGQTKSILDGIPGVGAVMRKRLVRIFGSGRGVREASLDELKNAVGEKTGQSIYDYLHNDSAILDA